MRLTHLGNRLALLAALLGAVGPTAGCRRTPYIDQSREVPRQTLGLASEADGEVQKAQFLTPMPLPKIAEPRTTGNPEAMEIWELTLQDAIRIGLENSEVIRVIALGAQGIPVGGFEPVPLSTGAGGALGTGTLQTVYDPAIQETQIAQALSVFDANLQTSLLWGRNVQPFNNAISAGTFIAGPRFPVVFNQETATFAAQLQKRNATGGVMGVAHNIQYLYSNSPTNVYPSVFTTNTQLTFNQPLLGGSQQNGPSGLQANRAPILVARLNADVAVWRFKAEVMALVRSIEQQYWALAQQHVRLWAAETAVDLGQQIFEREQAQLQVGVRALPNVAEAQENLERFRLDFLSATADVITTERQLRNILGLPPSDNRRIVPVTAPTEARLQPDWNVSLAQMVTYQPDIVQGQLLVRLAELQLLIARNQLLPALNFQALYQFNGLGDNLDAAEGVMTGKTIQAIDPLLSSQQRSAGLNTLPGAFNNFVTWQVGFTFQMPLGFRGPLANAKQAQYALLRQRAFLQQTVHQTTHSLSRFFLEVDANYKQYKTATRLKEAALVRLDAQKAYYEEGTITIDRYLDAVNRWANAVAQEADFKSRYNTAIAALEEAKGTLLGYDNIALSEGPWPRKAYIQARDQQEAHRQLPVSPDGPHIPDPINGPPQLDPVVPNPPPTFTPDRPRPPFPAPVGPLLPNPRPAPPVVPAGEPNTLSDRVPPREEPGVLPASAGADIIDLPALPPSDPGPEPSPSPSPSEAMAPRPLPELPPGPGSIAAPPASEVPEITLPALPPAS